MVAGPWGSLTLLVRTRGFPGLPPVVGVVWGLGVVEGGGGGLLGGG